MGELAKLYPKTLWEIFDNICAIPHPSKHEEKLAAWMMEWAKKNNIECKQDATGNLVFRKPATKGMEKLKQILVEPEDE